MFLLDDEEPFETSLSPEKAEKVREEIRTRRERNLMMRTSHGRFHLRIRDWRESGENVLKHHAWWLVHNVIAHPLIGFLPIEKTFAFHDFTSDKINRKVSK